MAANPWALYGNALELIWSGSLNMGTDTFRMVLVTGSYTPNQSTDAAWSTISGNEVANGNGYATHGKAITPSIGRSGLVVTFDCDDQSWTSSTITATYAVIVKDADSNGALAAGDIPVAYVELEDGSNVSTTNGTLAVNINAGGVYQDTAATAV